MPDYAHGGRTSARIHICRWHPLDPGNNSLVNHVNFLCGNALWLIPHEYQHNAPLPHPDTWKDAIKRLDVEPKDMPGLCELCLNIWQKGAGACLDTA